MAQTRALSSNDVAVLLASGTSHERILATARSSCLDFLLDAAHERPLRIAGADSAIIAGLREVCYQGSSIEVETDPSGAEVRIDGRRVGVSPWSGPVSPSSIQLDLRRGDAIRLITVPLPPGQFTRVTVALARDTLPLPAAPTRDEIARLRVAAQTFTPSQPKPVAPIPPGRGSALGGTLIGALIGGGAGAGLGIAVCKQSIITYSRAMVGSTPYLSPSGTTSQTQTPCAAAAGGGGLVAGGLLGNLIAHMTHGGKVRAYEAASRNYPVALARWQEQADIERSRYTTARQATVDSAESAADSYDRIAALNVQTRTRNSALPLPVIRSEPAHRFERVGAPPDP